MFRSYSLIIILLYMQAALSKKLSSPCKVGIIGAGAAGLAAAKVLSVDHHIDIDIRVFEKSDHIGGVWKYSPKSTSCSSGNDNPMYKSLRTNLPVEIMSFSLDDPFIPGSLAASSYLGHEDVQRYLENFSDKYELHKYISFKSEVVRLEKDPSTRLWIIESSSSSSDTNNIEFFDHVIVCNGHFNTPYIPDIDGFGNYKGLSLHSCHYDNNTEYLNKLVLIVGTKSSGTDIAYEISSVAKKVYVCDRQRSAMVEDHHNIILCPDISHIDTTGAVVFIDGRIIVVDCIVWCTGYEYSFPFLQSSTLNSFEDEIPSTISIAGGRAVLPLFKQLYYARDPTLSFIGLPYSVIPFPLMHLQARWIASCISGICQFPSVDEMYQSFLDEWADKHRGGKLRTYHNLGDYLQFEYMRYMAEQTTALDERLSSYIEMIESIYYDNSANKPIYPGAQPAYRNRRYKINW